MSTNENGVSRTTAVSIDPNSYVQSVHARIQELRRWREEIPHFVLPRSVDATKRMNATSSVPIEFIEGTMVAMANEAALVRGDSASPGHIRDLVDFGKAHLPLADELEALAQFIRHSAAAARNEAGLEALNVYAQAQRLAKQPRYASLAPYVADMRRALGRAKKLTPEAAAQKAAERAAKAAAKAATRAAKALPPEPTTTTTE